MRCGVTMLELLLVLVVIGIVTAITIPPMTRVRDWLAADRAATEAAAFYHRARLSAMWRARVVRIDFTSHTLRATYEGSTDSIFLVMAGPRAHGVELTASRPTIRILPTGFGWGAANTKLIFRKGAAAESLTTSRLGRLRRW